MAPAIDQGLALIAKLADYAETEDYPITNAVQAIEAEALFRDASDEALTAVAGLAIAALALVQHEAVRRG